MYKPIYTLQQLQTYLSDAPVVAFDFETAPDEKYRNEDKAALYAHKSHIAGISFSVAEGSGVYLPIAHRIGQNAEELTEIWACWLIFSPARPSQKLPTTSPLKASFFTEQRGSSGAFLQRRDIWRGRPCGFSGRYHLPRNLYCAL